ncbi:MAG: hypothetical protein JHC93_07420 [Parachlamydiales bacterium]|nr:hypothetical protein [Parachlamydiales bacterium]
MHKTCSDPYHLEYFNKAIDYYLLDTKSWIKFGASSRNRGELSLLERNVDLLLLFSNSIPSLIFSNKRDKLERRMFKARWFNFPDSCEIRHEVELLLNAAKRVKQTIPYKGDLISDLNKINTIFLDYCLNEYEFKGLFWTKHVFEKALKILLNKSSKL